MERSSSVNRNAKGRKPGIFRSGTSGLVLSEPNKKHYPEEFQRASRLSYYASKFNSIEINSSFYKLPLCRTYERWSSEVPGDFQFSIKLWKGITHNKIFAYEMQDLRSFFSAVDCLGKNKGCLLIQFPASSGMEDHQLRNLLDSIKELDIGQQWRLALEFRHNRWYDKKILKIIRDYRASLVLHDIPKSFMDQLPAGSPFVYIRFHGEKGDYRGSYPDEQLNEKAKKIRQWLNGGIDVYAYFNNTMGGGAAANLKTLNEMVDNSASY